jgi:hypothetical protein
VTGTLLGLTACTLTLLSSYLIGEKRAAGFLVSAVSQLFWFSRGLADGLVDLLVISTIFLVIAIWNYRKWTYSPPCNSHANSA